MPKKVATPATEGVDPGVILQLDPSTVLADDNTRFNLKESRIQTLAESILAQGGVIEPVEVEPIPEPQSGFLYRLNMGFYRHAAVKYLNTTQAAGLTLPAVLHVTSNPTERLKRQLAENIERENQSPMDQAIAIKRLFDADIPRIEIRQMFSRPGGRKGGKVQPASNSFINMTMSFLDLPKSVQEKIHLGTVGVAAAYQLTKVDPEKRATVLERAEEERQKELAAEEKDEERFLAQEKKATEQQGKVDTAKAALEKAETKSRQASDQLKKATDLVTTLFAASKGKFDTAKDKKAAQVAFKEAEKQQVVAEADATKAQDEYEKAQVAYSKLTEPAKKAKKEAAKKQAVSAQQVQKAAKETGASAGAVPLNAGEMRKVVIDMCLPGGDETVIAIGKAIQACFAGITTPEQLYRELKKLVA